MSSKNKFNNPLNPKNPSILVFDSGIGGISVAQSIKRLLPKLVIHYCCDNKFLPYGKQPETFLLQRVPKLIGLAVEKTQPQLIVIACNTASTVILPTLRANFDCPVVGVVPAIKPASNHCRHIALLATKATLERDYTQDLIKQFAHDCKVVHVDATKLVDLAEKKMTGELSVNQTDSMKAFELPELTNALQCHPVETAVLGCTHFPLLNQELQRAYPKVEAWLDSGEAIARRVKSLLEQSLSDIHTLEEPSIADSEADTQFFSTAEIHYQADRLSPLQFTQKSILQDC